MSDDDLRDDLGDSIALALESRSVADDGPAGPRVHALVRRRRRVRSAVVSGTAVLVVVALVAILATTRSTGRSTSTTPTTHAPASCRSSAPPTSNEHVKRASLVRWRGETFVAPLTPPLVAPKLGAPIGRTCFQVGPTTPHDFRFRDGDSTTLPGGTTLYSVAGYRSTAAVGANVDGTTVVFTGRPDLARGLGMGLFDFTGGVSEVDISKVSPTTGARAFAVAQITGQNTIGFLIDAVRFASWTKPDDPHASHAGLTLTFVLRGGGAVVVDRETALAFLSSATDADLEQLYAETQRAVATSGIGVAEDGRVVLLADDGTPVSVLPPPQLPLNGVGALRVVGGAAGKGWALDVDSSTGTRPSQLAADCQRWSQSASYVVAVCGRPQLPDRLDVIGPRGTKSFSFAALQRGGGHFVDAFVRPDGWAAVETSGECEVPGTVYVDTTTGTHHTLPNAPESSVFGVRADGRFLVRLPEGVCGATGAPPGVYAIDPVTLHLQLVTRLDVHAARTQEVFRWFGPSGLGSG
jgi:hypothetical protein